LFISLGADRSRLRRVLVGAEASFFQVQPPPAEGPVRITYVGGFLPLHGVMIMLEAFAELESAAATLPDFVVQMVGEGIEYEQARAFVTQRRLTRVEFTGRLDYADAPRVLEPTHIALGAFGASEKAGRVIPHKLWQGLAAGRAVVTGDGAGPREVFRDGEDLLLVPRADAPALASALRMLIGSRERRAALGAAGRSRALATGSAEAIGEQLAEAFAGLPPGGGR
jgi:glycosyltransferase involved in cell wall biosynthesis